MSTIFDRVPAVRCPHGAAVTTLSVREVLVLCFDHVDRHKGEVLEDPSHFQGQVKIQRFPGSFPGGVEIIAVHFEAGGRTRPHSHSAGQVLHVTSGKGIVATRSARRFIEPGDIVIVTPGEWHWHGGTTSSAMTHVAMQLPRSTNWEEPELDWARDYDET
jgi:quercetin dioxygenase-like cupin family protein